MGTRNVLSRAGIFPREKVIDLMRAEGRVSLAVLATWLLPALLCTMQGDGAVRSFLSDCALHTKSLVAIPIFILGEYTCLPLLREIAQHFDHLAWDDDCNRCRACISSALSFKAPASVIIGSTLCAYALVLVSIRRVPLASMPSWQKIIGHGHPVLSFAGWWHWLVGIPLLLFLFFIWLFRVFVWSRFLWQMSRLHLRLVLSHPDRVGGLKFLGYTPAAFIPLSFALGAILAGMVANRVLHFGESLVKYKSDVIGVAITVIILFCGPLAFFAGKLFNAQRHGILKYSGLANDIGCRFEQKWLDRSKSTGRIGEDALEAPDFSATTDLYSIVDNVYSTRLLPLDLRCLALLVTAAVLPFFPVALIQVPFRTIMEKMAAMLM